MNKNQITKDALSAIERRVKQDEYITTGEASELIIKVFSDNGFIYDEDNDDQYDLYEDIMYALQNELYNSFCFDNGEGFLIKKSVRAIRKWLKNEDPNNHGDYNGCYMTLANGKQVNMYYFN